MADTKAREKREEAELDGRTPKEGFDIDTALNTKGFAEFLAEVDTEDIVENSEEVEKRFEAFQLKKEVSGEIRGVIKEQLKKDTGIELSDKDLECLDAYISKEALANPEGVKEIMSSLKDLTELPKQVEELEKQLAAMDGKDVIQHRFDKTKDKMWLLTATNPEGWEKWPKATPEDREKIKKVTDALDEVKVRFGVGRGIFGGYGKIDKLIKATEDELVALRKSYALHTEVSDKTKEMKRRLTAAKDRVFADAVAGAQIGEVVRRKMDAKLTELAGKKDTKSAQAAYDIIRNFNTGQYGNPDIIIEGLGFDKEQQWVKWADDSLEAHMATSLEAAVKKSRLGEGALASLEAAVTKLSEKETMGSKDAQGVKEFIVLKLHEIMTSLGTTGDDKAKRLLVKRLFIKMSNN